MLSLFLTLVARRCSVWHCCYRSRPPPWLRRVLLGGSSLSSPSRSSACSSRRRFVGEFHHCCCGARPMHRGCVSHLHVAAATHLRHLHHHFRYRARYHCFYLGVVARHACRLAAHLKTQYACHPLLVAWQRFRQSLDQTAVCPQAGPSSLLAREVPVWVFEKKVRQNSCLYTLITSCAQCACALALAYFLLSLLRICFPRSNNKRADPAHRKGRYGIFECTPSQMHWW